MRIFLASDHAGFLLKEKIKEHLRKKKIFFEDFGAKEYNEKDDYPDFIIPCCKKVANTKDSFGIILGGSGQGEAIIANKIKGTRAATYYSPNLEIIKLSKEHNNANVLSLGARFLKESDALAAIDLWLKTKFNSEERHLRRIKKISDYESKK